MIESIGEIDSSSGEKMIRMWRVSVPAGHRPLQRHSHIQFEITLVTGGRGEYTVGDNVFPMLPGDIFVFSSNECHSITNVDTCGLNIVNLHFEPRCLWGASLDSLSGENVNLCFSHSAEFENRIPASDAAPLASVFNAMKNELSDKKPEYKLMTKSLLNQLLIMLVRDFGYADSSLSVSRTHVHSIRKALAYIDSHISEKLTLGEISRIAGVSSTYFSALFKQISSITLWDYIFSKRIEKAIHLITESKSSDTMLEIALQCGFNNTANFNKIFRRKTGMTPTEYMKQDIKNIS